MYDVCVIGTVKRTFVSSHQLQQQRKSKRRATSPELQKVEKDMLPKSPLLQELKKKNLRSSNQLQEVENYNLPKPPCFQDQGKKNLSSSPQTKEVRGNAVSAIVAKRRLELRGNTNIKVVIMSPSSHLFTF